MLKAIAAANMLCYHAQCHYLKASSLAADRPYHNAKFEFSAQRNKPLVDALRESHLGSDELRKAFSLIRGNPVLAQNFPVLTSQSNSVPTMDLQRLDARSVTLFANLDHDKNASREADLLEHCGSILRFVHRCLEIAGHQRKLLEAVELQIHAENHPAFASGHRMGERNKHGLCHNNLREVRHHMFEEFNNCYREYHQDLNDASGPDDILARAVETATKADQLQFIPNPQRGQQRITADVTMLAGAGLGCHTIEYRPKSIVYTSIPHVPIPKAEEEFEPLSIDEGVDLKGLSTPVSSFMEELASISPDEVFTDSKVSANRQRRRESITPDEIFTDSKICREIPPFAVPEYTVVVSTDTHLDTNNAPPSTTSKVSQSTEKGKTAIVRTRSSDHFQPRRTKKRLKAQKPQPVADSSGDMLALALGGRMDFMKEDAVFGKGGRNHSGDGVRLDCTDDNSNSNSNTSIHSDDSSNEFPFNDNPLFRRAHSF